VFEREPVERGPEMLLGVGELRAAQVEPAHAGVRLGVAGIAADGLLPIRIGVERRVVELVDAQAGEVEFLVGLELLRRGRQRDTAGCGMGVSRIGE
jgi:hypothetical protein